MMTWAVVLLWVVACTGNIQHNGHVHPTSACIKDPSPAICQEYHIPDANLTALVNQMCVEMPKMAHCSLVPICHDPTQTVSSPLCDPFSLYKDVCVAMNSMGSICSSYRTMCNMTISVVEDCLMPTFIIPSRNTLVNDVVSICGEMWMDGCDQCNAQVCNSPLEVYSYLCLQMPEMKACEDWHNICEQNNISSWSICGGGPEGSIVPQMRMYFHTEMNDYILFKTWVPTDVPSYVGSVIAVFFWAFCHEGLRILKVFLETKWRNNKKKTEKPATAAATAAPVPTMGVFEDWDPLRDGIAALYRMVDLTFHFLIMLITMTFNVGLFVAVIGGYGVCNFIFGRFSRPINVPYVEENCHDCKTNVDYS